MIKSKLLIKESRIYHSACHSILGKAWKECTESERLYTFMKTFQTGSFLKKLIYFKLK